MEKVCPLLALTGNRGESISCGKKRCAWWLADKEDEKYSMCAITDIALQLSHLNSTLEYETISVMDVNR